MIVFQSVWAAKALGQAPLALNPMATKGDAMAKATKGTSTGRRDRSVFILKAYLAPRNAFVRVL